MYRLQTTSSFVAQSRRKVYSLVISKFWNHLRSCEIVALPDGRLSSFNLEIEKLVSIHSVELIAFKDQFRLSLILPFASEQIPRQFAAHHLYITANAWRWSWSSRKPGYGYQRKKEGICGTWRVNTGFLTNLFQLSLRYSLSRLLLLSASICEWDHTILLNRFCISCLRPLCFMKMIRSLAPFSSMDEMTAAKEQQRHVGLPLPEDCR